MDLYNKIYAFLNLAKKKGIDENIIQSIQSSIDSKILNESVNFLEILAFPKLFLEQISGSKIFKDSESTELLRLKDDIEKTLDDRNIDITERSEMIKVKLVEILSILIMKSDIPARNIECFQVAIDQLISALQMIKTQLEGKEMIDFGQVYSILVSSIQEVHEKTKDKASESSLTELEMLKISLESLTQSIDKRNSIKLVIDAVKDIRKHIGMTGL